MTLPSVAAARSLETSSRETVPSKSSSDIPVLPVHPGSPFSIHLASSLVLSTPASSLSTSAFVRMGRPRSRSPCVASHSSNYLILSLILLAAMFSLTLGIPSQRVDFRWCVNALTKFQTFLLDEGSGDIQAQPQLPPLLERPSQW